MVIVQFGFNPDDPRNPHDPANHVAHRIAYTGTHDHDTVRGWYESLGPDVPVKVDAAIDGAGVREPESWWALIRLAIASPARVAMVQVQDVLGLGCEARMNVPGTTGKSWRWGLEELPSADLGRRLREASEEASRVNGGH